MDTLLKCREGIIAGLLVRFLNQKKNSYAKELMYSVGYRCAFEVNRTAVKEHLENISTSLRSIGEKIQEETKAVDAQIALLVNEVESRRNKDVLQLKKEVANLSQEVRQYQHLASLSESQAQAVSATLQRGKYLDYSIGLFLGNCQAPYFPLFSGCLKARNAKQLLRPTTIRTGIAPTN